MRSKKDEIQRQLSEAFAEGYSNVTFLAYNLILGVDRSMKKVTLFNRRKEILWSQDCVDQYAAGQVLKEIKKAWPIIPKVSDLESDDEIDKMTVLGLARSADTLWMRDVFRDGERIAVVYAERTFAHDPTIRVLFWNDDESYVCLIGKATHSGTAIQTVMDMEVEQLHKLVKAAVNSVDNALKEAAENAITDDDVDAVLSQGDEPGKPDLEGVLKLMSQAINAMSVVMAEVSKMAGEQAVYIETMEQRITALELAKPKETSERQKVEAWASEVVGSEMLKLLKSKTLSMSISNFIANDVDMRRSLRGFVLACLDDADTPTRAEFDNLSGLYSKLQGELDKIDPEPECDCGFDPDEIENEFDERICWSDVSSIIEDNKLLDESALAKAKAELAGEMQQIAASTFQSAIANAISALRAIGLSK